ncbi:MAG: hypothetical protein RLZZ514_441, partial [Actinomycetota bacterium]
MSMQGVQNEEKIELDKEEQRAVRKRSMALLGSIIRPVRNRLWGSLFLVIGSQGLRVSMPFLMAVAIDTALPAAVKGDLGPLWGISAAYLGAAVASSALIAFFVRYAARINQDIMFALRGRLFRHTQKLSVQFHETYTSGRVISRQTNDLDSIMELLNSGGNEMIAGLLYMIFAAIALILLDAPSFGIMVISFIPLWFLTRWFQKMTRLNYRKTRVASAKQIVHFVETMTGIRAVKAFRKERANEEKFGELVEDYRSVNAKVIQLFGIYDPGLILIGQVTSAFILLYGGLRVMEGTLGVGVMMAALLYARRFYDPMEQLAMFYNSFQSANSGLEKISGVLQEEPSVADPVEPVEFTDSKGHIEFEDVRFSYGDGKEVLHEFSLDIPAGQTIALVGTTGAGKSTLAKLVSRFYDPTTGT